MGQVLCSTYEENVVATFECFKETLLIKRFTLPGFRYNLADREWPSSGSISSWNVHLGNWQRNGWLVRIWCRPLVTMSLRGFISSFMCSWRRG